jgi:hypothetical protein
VGDQPAGAAGAAGAAALVFRALRAGAFFFAAVFFALAAGLRAGAFFEAVFFRVVVFFVAIGGLLVPRHQGRNRGIIRLFGASDNPAACDPCL